MTDTRIHVSLLITIDDKTVVHEIYDRKVLRNGLDDADLAIYELESVMEGIG